MSNLTVLMYHAVPPVIQTDGHADYDPHYAVSVEDFTKQMEFIHRQGKRGSKIAGRDSNDNHVYITFDDGHLTNYTHALPILVEYGYTAEFYINTATIGTPGYVSWAQLNEMHSAGMSIESHGHDHVLMNELSAEAVTCQLQRSYELIAQHIGTAPSVFSPPGGRMHPIMQTQVPETGYTYVAYSEPGVWDGQSKYIPRYPVLAQGNAQFEAAVQQQLTFRIKTRVRHELMGIAKKALGNNGYNRLRSKLLEKGQDS